VGKGECRGSTLAWREEKGGKRLSKKKEGSSSASGQMPHKKMTAGKREVSPEGGQGVFGQVSNIARPEKKKGEGRQKVKERTASLAAPLHSRFRYRSETEFSRGSGERSLKKKKTKKSRAK